MGSRYYTIRIPFRKGPKRRLRNRPKTFKTMVTAEKYAKEHNLKDCHFENIRISTGKIGFARELTKEKIHDIINDLSCIVAVIKTAPYKKLTQNDEKLKNNAHSSLVYAAGIIRDIVLIKEGCATLTTYTFLKKELTALSLRFSYVTLLSALDYIVSMTRFLKQNVNTSLVWNNFFLLFNNKN